MTKAPPRLSANGEYGLPVDRTITSRIRAFVDGDFLRHLIAYDMEAGWVEVIEHDENGFLTHRDGEWVTRRIFGKVEVTLLPEDGQSA